MKSLLLIISVIILFPNVLFSQSYTFSATTGTYAGLDNPVSLNNGQVWELPAFEIPIGFDFWFFNSSIDTLYFFEDGAGSVLSTSKLQSGLHKLLIPYGTSLIDRGYGTSLSQSPLSYELSGESGSRILKIEWKNAGFYGDFENNGTSTDYVNFQLWLHETTGHIEIHYGPSLINYPALDFNDESGPSVSLIPSYDYNLDVFSPNSLWLEGSPLSPVMITSDNFVFLNGSVSPNTIYKFDNLTVGSPGITVNEPVVYPNPVKDLLNIRLNTVLTSPAAVIICDITGRNVYNAAVSANQTGELQINVSDLNAGIFQLIIQKGQETYTSRFVKL